MSDILSTYVIEDFLIQAVELNRDKEIETFLAYLNNHTEVLSTAIIERRAKLLADIKMRTLQRVPE